MTALKLNTAKGLALLLRSSSSMEATCAFLNKNRQGKNNLGHLSNYIQLVTESILPLILDDNS